MSLNLLLRKEAAKDEVAQLVYADWLDEQGDPRGELIRINVELSKMTYDQGLVACQACNPYKLPSADIYPTGCDVCPEQSGWMEAMTKEDREHFHQLIERRLEILENLPKRWYAVLPVLEVMLAGFYDEKGPLMCVLAASPYDACAFAKQHQSHYLIGRNSWGAGSPIVWNRANVDFSAILIQTVVPYEV